MSFRPPESYEDLIKLIHDRYDDMSKSYQKIALYLTQNPNDVAVLSVNAIGAKCGIHASSFVRYAQSLGYKGFKELQSVFQRRRLRGSMRVCGRLRRNSGVSGKERWRFLRIWSQGTWLRCKSYWRASMLLR
jgi:DNA-binding MurR/RpiR family transcriptional regulator